MSVKLPVMVRVDNVETTFMASNITTMNENVEDGVVKIIFKSADKDSDTLTKNLCAELHEKHSKNIVVEKLNDVLSFKNI